jgi:hypothetical protein
VKDEFYLPSKPCLDCGQMMKYSTDNKKYCNDCSKKRYDKFHEEKAKKDKAERTIKYENAVKVLKEKFGDKYFTAKDIAIALRYTGGNYGTSGQGMGKTIHAMLRRGMLERYSKRYYKIVGEQPR